MHLGDRDPDRRVGTVLGRSWSYDLPAVHRAEDPTDYPGSEVVLDAPPLRDLCDQLVHLNAKPKLFVNFTDERLSS